MSSNFSPLGSWPDAVRVEVLQGETEWVDFAMALGARGDAAVPGQFFTHRLGTRDVRFDFRHVIGRRWRSVTHHLFQGIDAAHHR